MNENKGINTPLMGDQLDDMTSLKRILSTNEWVDEARQIPLQELDPLEQELIIKCINKEPLTDIALDKLEIILGRYREALTRHQPEETVTAIKDNIQHIKDCDTLLEKLEQARKEEITTIPFNMPTKQGTISIELDVYPITDSTILFDPNSHFAPLMNQTEEIIQNKDTPASIEDTQVQQQIQQQAQELIDDQLNLEMMIELLSKQTSLHGQPRNHEKMQQIYTAMPPVYIAALTTRIQPLILDSVYNVEMDKVFQKIDQ